MSTSTLFKTLDLSTGTWLIELRTSNDTTRAAASVRADDVVRVSVPADPWWEQVGTQIMKGVNCGD